MKLFLKILLIVLWISLAVGSAVLMGFANQRHEAKKCIGTEVEVNYAGSERLITAEDLKRNVSAVFGKLERKNLQEIDIEKILHHLRSNPYIATADAHITVEGKMIIQITQCQPLVRIISSSDQNFYLDTKGKLLPVSARYPVRVVVANGNIEVPLETGRSIFELTRLKGQFSDKIQVLANIQFLSQELMADSVLNALVEQIYVKTDGEMQLITKAGSHIIEFGDTANTSEKLSNLKAIYKMGLSKTGWSKYSIINLKFKNQVVCTK